MTTTCLERLFAGLDGFAFSEKYFSSVSKQILHTPDEGGVEIISASWLPMLYIEKIWHHLRAPPPKTLLGAVLPLLATLPEEWLPKVRLGVVADPLRWLLPKVPPIEGLWLPLPVMGRLPLFTEGL